MTKSEMRRLQFQRKYANNEAYEKDKEALIDKQLILGNLDMVCLLQQSKWVGAVDGDVYAEGHRTRYIDGADEQQDCSYHKPCTILKDVAVTTIPS